VLSLLALIFLNACNTAKGTATGVGRDAKAIWHYTSCAWDWVKIVKKNNSLIEIERKERSVKSQKVVAHCAC